jgi:hypothetical protein
LNEWFIQASKNVKLTGQDYEDFKVESSEIAQKIVCAFTVGNVYVILRKIYHLLDDEIKKHRLSTGGLFAERYLSIMPQFSLRLLAIFAEVVMVQDMPLLWTVPDMIRYQLVFYLSFGLDYIYQVHSIKNCLITVEDWEPMVASYIARLMSEFFSSTPQWHVKARQPFGGKLNSL